MKFKDLFKKEELPEPTLPREPEKTSENTITKKEPEFKPVNDPKKSEGAASRLMTLEGLSNDKPKEDETEKDTSVPTETKTEKISFSSGKTGRTAGNREVIELDVLPKGAIKRRGRKNKSVTIVLPIDKMLVFSHNFLIAIVSFVIAVEVEDMELDEEEIKMLTPMLSAVVAKYLDNPQPETLFIISYSLVMVSKFTTALAMKKIAKKNAKEGVLP